MQPCLFIAAEYVLLGKLVQYLRGEKYLLIPSRRIMVIFLSSDIGTFLMQVKLYPFSAIFLLVGLSLLCPRLRVAQL